MYSSRLFIVAITNRTIRGYGKLVDVRRYVDSDPPKIVEAVITLGERLHHIGRRILPCGTPAQRPAWSHAAMDGRTYCETVLVSLLKDF